MVVQHATERSQQICLEQEEPHLTQLPLLVMKDEVSSTRQLMENAKLKSLNYGPDEKHIEKEVIQAIDGKSTFSQEQLVQILVTMQEQHKMPSRL